MKEIVISSRNAFEAIKRLGLEGGEYWSARDLAKVLQYSEYRHFLPVVEKAILACKNSGQPIENHLEEILEMVDIGSGASREITTYYLSRYACYLIIQNADPSKKIVAAGQNYFAIQTRKQELTEQSEDQKRILLREEMKKHNKHLASAAKDAGVITPLEFAIFQDYGYIGLYGGKRQKDIQKHKNLKPEQKILDHMGSTELAANLFRATQTEDKLKRDKIYGQNAANQAHLDVGKKVRETIKELGGTMPENLPVVEDIRKIERRERKALKGKNTNA